MPVYSDSADLTISSVQASFLQDSTDFIWTSLPKMRVKDEKQGFKDTIYSLPKLENTLTNGTKIVRYDEQPPEEQFTGDDPVTISAPYNQTLVTSEPIRGSELHRLADMEFNVPKHLNNINISFDLQCITQFTNTSAFSSSTFDGTGVLSAFNSDQNPVKDILDDLRPFRWMQQFTGLSLECYMDNQVATVLGGYEDFQNAMYASSGRQFVDVDAMSAALMRILDVDAVHIVRNAYNSAKPGLAQVGARVGSGLLWFGLLDRRQDDVDMVDQTDRGLDGGLAVVTGTPIFVKNWEPVGLEVEKMNARGGFSCTTPRFSATATQTGIFYPSSEIF